MSHINPNMSQSELIEKLADLALKKLDPETKAQSKANVPAASVEKKEATNQAQKHTMSASATLRKETVKQSTRTQKISRYIPSTIKQEVYLRDKGYCTFKDRSTNKQCSSKHLLQYDHIKPMAFGGKTAAHNLRLLCFNYHKLVTQKMFERNANGF